MRAASAAFSRAHGQHCSTAAEAAALILLLACGRGAMAESAMLHTLVSGAATRQRCNVQASSTFPKDCSRRGRDLWGACMQ